MAVYACSDLHGMLHFYKAIKDILIAYEYLTDKSLQK